MIRNTIKMPLSTTIVAALALIAGCGDTASSDGGRKSAGGVDAELATYEDHEHETPAHKPISFPDGVAELINRHAALKSPAIGTTPDWHQRRFQELREIVGWLPAMAADSDLSEAEWLPIEASLARIDAAYQKLQSHVDQGAIELPSTELDTAEREFATLQVIAVARLADFEATPRHDHAPEPVVVDSVLRTATP
jgi:hypothetical protein